MDEGQKELLNQLSIIEELATANICRMPDPLLSGLAQGIKAIVSHQYVRGISREDVARYYGISTRTLERWQLKYNDFPKPRHHGQRDVTFDYDEVIIFKRTHTMLFS